MQTKESSGNMRATGRVSRPTQNMYAASQEQWNPYVGCNFDCAYCMTSFQAQLKRQKHRCLRCYRFEPHEHADRLDAPLPRTQFSEFVFTCSNGDVAFCRTPYLRKIAARMKATPATTFLLQSKNPKTFGRVEWPGNVVLGTTIETNRDELCRAISKAPPPSSRIRDLAAIDHRSKMLTLEPVMRFDLKVLLGWVERIQPAVVWLGFDSRRTDLPEPTRDEVRELAWQIGLLGIAVRLKTIREGREGRKVRR